MKDPAKAGDEVFAQPGTARLWPSPNVDCPLAKVCLGTTEEYALIGLREPMTELLQRSGVAEDAATGQTVLVLLATRPPVPVQWVGKNSPQGLATRSQGWATRIIGRHRMAHCKKAAPHARRGQAALARGAAVAGPTDWQSSAAPAATARRADARHSSLRRPTHLGCAKSLRSDSLVSCF